VFGAGLFNSHIILWGCADLRHLADLSEVWLFILPFALAMLLLEELPRFAVVRLKR